jgi:tRNA dimethylallyltransferase
MDIGTAKPSDDDQARVQHWGINLISPDERFSVAEFKQYATKKIVEIRKRGHIPFIVGGTGLYVDALLYDYQFGTRADPAERLVFEKMSLEALYEYCTENNVVLPENYKNKRYVIRAIEQKSVNNISKRPLHPNSYIVGIATDMATLKQQIAKRTEHMFSHDVAKEATMLGKKYGWNHESMTGNIYPLLRSYLENEISLEEAKIKFTTLDYQLAKRQMTWLRRNPDIVWVSITEAKGYINTLLATE